MKQKSRKDEDRAQRGANRFRRGAYIDQHVFSRIKGEKIFGSSRIVDCDYTLLFSTHLYRRYKQMQKINGGTLEVPIENYNTNILKKLF